MATKEDIYDQLLEAVKKGEIDMETLARAAGSGAGCPCTNGVCGKKAM